MKNLPLLWAKGLVYFPPIWPYKGSITPTKVYAEVMRQERSHLYASPEVVEDALRREENNLRQECLALGKRMREKELVTSNQEHSQSSGPEEHPLEHNVLRDAG